MEKVKITNMQKETLERYLRWIRSENSIGEESNALEYFIENSEDWVDDFKPLKYFSVNDFSLILNGFYEIKQNLKAGDWFYNQEKGDYAKVAVITHLGGISYRCSHTPMCAVVGNSEDFQDRFKKVTEPWKIMLLDLGREKPELKIGDVFIKNNGDPVLVSGGFVSEVIHEMFVTDAKLFCPVESQIKVKN